MGSDHSSLKTDEKQETAAKLISRAIELEADKRFFDALVCYNGGIELYNNNLKRKTCR